MELILLSVFGIASLFVLELCGLFYERWLREPHLMRAITKQGGINLHAHPQASGPVPAERALHCSDAANDAGATTIRRVVSRNIHRRSTGE